MKQIMRKPVHLLLLYGLAALSLLLARPAAAITIDRVVSPGGIEAWLVQDHTLQLVTIELSFTGGAVDDPLGKAGLANMAASLLDEGAGALDSQAFQGRLEDLASSVSFSASHDYVTGSLRTITAQTDAAFELLRLALTEPRFDAEAVARIRGDLVAGVRRRDENPNAIAGRVWWRNAFADHPYARPTDGTEETIAAITADDLHGFVKQRLARNVLRIAVVGDITPEALQPLLDKTFGALPADAAPSTIPDGVARDAGALLLVKKPIPQSVAIFGEEGIKRSDPDWYAAFVDNYVLGGGGFSSRLMAEVREKRGLAYGVGTYLLPMRSGAVLLGQVATQNGRVVESIEVIRQEWQRFHDDGPTAQELADAKTYLTGSFAAQLDSTGHIAGTLIQLQQETLGIDYLDRRNALIDGVTLDEAKRVAKRIFDPAALGFTVVGSPTNLTPTKEVSAGGS
jgi:zinc protease